MSDDEQYPRVIPFNNGDSELIIYQETVTDVGGVIWDSALMTIHYFFKNAKQFEGKKVLELGSGTGVCGIALASLGAEVIITDLPERIPLIKKNVEVNQKLTGDRIKIQVLDWTKETIPKGLDIVVAVDCVYYNSTIDPLIQLLNDSNAEEIIVVSEVRDIGEASIAQKSFYEKIKKFFHFDAIPQKEFDPDYFADDIIVGKLTKNL